MKTLVNFSLMLLLCLVISDLKAQSVCVPTNNYDVTTLSGQTISINNVQPATEYYLVCEGPINNGRAGTQSDPFYNVAYFLLAGIGITPNTLNGPTFISDPRGDNVMEEILLDRYNQFLRYGMTTHVTTRRNAEELEKLYGRIVRSRLREMCNLISFPGEAKDRRK